MFRRYYFLITASLILTLAAAAGVYAQTGELRGHVLIEQAGGAKTPASEALIDVYRTDLPGKYNTKANKKGEFVFAGLPYIGEYILVVSAANAAPTYQPRIRAGRGVDYEFVLSPGDGRRLTIEEVRAAMARNPDTASSSGGGESAEDRAKREELMRKNAEIEAQNKKAMDINATILRTFKAGNEALQAKNYDEAIKQFDEGIAADPEQPALLTNKANALKLRGVQRYNAAVVQSDDAAKSAGIKSAQADFTAAKDASTKAVNFIKAQSSSATDAAEQARLNSNKLAAMNVRAESMRLFVTKVDAAQVDAGVTAYQEYLAVETDPKRKAEAEQAYGQMLFDANAFDKALAQYQKILEANPDDLNALLKSGMALFNIGAMNNGDKAKYQEAANFLARFVEKAPDNDAMKADAKAILENLKAAENVKPEKVTTPTRRRARP